MAELTIDGGRLITDDEAAELLHQKKQTLAVWRGDERGPPYLKIGRRIFYELSAIEAWLVTQRRTSTR